MRTFAIVLVLALFLPLVSSGQSELIIEPYSVNSKYLNEVIRGDTTLAGARVDPQRVYVLRKGGLYFANSFIQNTGYALRIKAEETAGVKPVINAFRGATGTYAAQIFQVDTLLWLRNLSMNGWDEGGEDFAVYQSRIINVNRIGSEVNVDSCTFNGSTGTLIQTSVAARYVRVTNSTFVNAGNVRANNLGNGRAIDFRNVSIDSARIENCSFFNMSDRVFRHFGAGQVPLRNLTINHNTVFNELAEHGCMGLGKVDGTFRITNNLFVDNFIFGNDSTATERLGEFGDTDERGPSGAYRMTFMGTMKDTVTATTYVIRNNYYSVSPSLQAFYDSRNGRYDAGVGNLIPLTWYINGKLGADSVKAFYKVQDPIVFTKAPPTAVSMATWFFLPIDSGGSGKIKQNATFLPQYDWARVVTQYLTDTLDFRYQTNSPAYTGADQGQPVGDLRWWNLTPVSVEGPSGPEMPSTFALGQNYPNPFNPATKIPFDLPQGGIVVLKVFNVIGQEVATLQNGRMDAGKHEIVFDAAGLPTGVYFCRLGSGSNVATGRMLLLK